MKQFAAIAKTSSGSEVQIATTPAETIELARPVLERFADMTSSGPIRIEEIQPEPQAPEEEPQEIAEEAPIVRTRKGYTFEIQVNLGNATPAKWTEMGTLPDRHQADAWILKFWKQNGTAHVARIQVRDQDGNFAGWMS
jgi:hypothetical protein